MSVIINSVNPTKLLSEFTAANIIWCNATNDLMYDDNGVATTYMANLTVDFAVGTDMQLVQQVIDEHDPTPSELQPTREEVLEQELARTNEMILELTELMLGGM